MSIHLSVQRGTSPVLFDPLEVGSIEEVAEVICSGPAYSTIWFKESYRVEDNFLGAEMIGLDFDEGRPTLAEARELFKNYKHIIATTKSHQKAKEGKAPCDRYRVLLFLAKPLTSAGAYKATWQALNQKFIGIDGNTKDAARLWFASKEVVSINKEGRLVEPQEAPAQPAMKLPAKRTEEQPRGSLSVATCKLLVNGAEVGSRNKSYHLAARDFHQAGYSYEEAEDKLLGAPRHGDFSDEEIISTVRSAYKKPPLYEARVKEDKQLHQLINNNNYLFDVETGTGLLYVKNEGYVLPILEESLRNMLGADGLKYYRASNYKYCKFVYSPYRLEPLFTDERGILTYNTYQPPQWQHRLFFFGEPLAPPPKEPPKIYQEFFAHLCNGEQDSIEYTYDWLATAIRGRNLTMLVAIGDEGGGKGVFGRIMQKLFGANYVRVRDTVLKNKFNKPLQNKRMVYFDEVTLTTDEHHNALKNLVNDEIEIEAKGVDEKSIVNFASFFISSNNLHAIKPSSSDRRFSIIQITDNKLWGAPNKLIERIDSEILNDENIDAFARWLNARQFERNMLMPFRSKRFEDVKEASLNEWEYYIVFEWTSKKVNKFVPINQIQDDLRHHTAINPGRVKLSQLTKKYPEFLEWRKANGTQGIFVKASPAPAASDITMPRLQTLKVQ